MDILGGGLVKFQIFLGVLEIPDIFFGVNGRCWVRAYVWRKNETPPPPGVMTISDRVYWVRMNI